MRKIQASDNPWIHSTTAALLTAAAGFVFFGVFFRYEPPKVAPPVHRAGKASLLTLRAEDEVMGRWLEVHDPSRIALGRPPVIRKRPYLPPDSTKPDPLYEPEAPREPVPVPFVMEGVSAGNVPKFHAPLPVPVFPAIPPENFPKFTVNGIREKLILPDDLLKLAASVNAGTVEMRLGQGVLPEERRIEVLRSSGSSRVDRILAEIFASRRFPELPARLKLVWDSTGEKEP